MEGLHTQRGFIPNTLLPAVVDDHKQSVDWSDMRHWVKTAHNEAIQFDAPNYMEARIQVVSQLKVKQWRHLLSTYKYNRVCDYIEFRFPLTLDYDNFEYNTQV